MNMAGARLAEPEHAADLGERELFEVVEGDDGAQLSSALGVHEHVLG